MSTDKAKPAEVPVPVWATRVTESRGHVRLLGYMPEVKPGLLVQELIDKADHLAAMEALRQELADAKDATRRLAEEMEYQGNSVSFIYAKKDAYRAGIDETFAALKRHGVLLDGSTRLADLVGRELAARDARIAELAEVAAKLCSLGIELAACAKLSSEGITNITHRLRQRDECIESVGGSLVHPDDAAKAGAAIGPGFEPMR